MFNQNSTTTGPEQCTKHTDLEIAPKLCKSGSAEAGSEPLADVK